MDDKVHSFSGLKNKQTAYPNTPVVCLCLCFEAVVMLDGEIMKEDEEAFDDADGLSSWWGSL